jgi:murein DD-endopeptidase MepM/ murein hydrolase activator NlpD
MGLKEKTQFTIVFIPHHGGKTVSLRVPQWLLVCLACFGVFLLLGLGLVTTGYINKFVDVSMLQKLQVENNILRSKIGEFTAKTGEMQKQIDQFINFDSKIRMMSGLQSIDPDIRQVGIGGVKKETMPQEVTANTASSIKEVEDDLNKLIREAKLQDESFRELSKTLQERQDMWDHMPSIQPTPGWIISEFGYRRDPLTGEMRMHEGIDIAAPSGTIITAPADGVVKYVGSRGNYGLCLEIDHGYGVYTRFAHCSLIRASLGSKVTRGQVVALVGSTGRVTGPHLHYEVITSDKTTDPINYILSARMF